MDSHDPRDVALGRSAIESGIIDRSHASRILAIATAQRCGFLEAARRLGLPQNVIDRLLQVRPPSTSHGVDSQARPTLGNPTPAPGSAGQRSSGSHNALDQSGRRTSSAPGSRRALAKRLEPGAPFAGHVIEKTLGQGGMGVVLLARDPAGAKHAIKVPFFDENAEDRRKRFVREAQALAKLNHPNVLKVHAVGEDDGAPFCVMELVDGDALDALVEKGALELSRALEIAEEVARALAHAHAAGIVHRDVKPSNVMVRSDDGRAVLMDFGLARDDEAERLTKTGAMLGTPRYMAPEQAMGAKHVDGRADVYALGATLYELVVGAPVFDADSTIALIAKITTEPAEAPSKKKPGLPAAVDAIVLRALEKSPDDRYPTMEAMAEDLARARRGEAVGERPRLVARRRRAIVVGIALVLLVGTAAGVLVTHAARTAKLRAREERRAKARDRVLAVAEPWRRARFGLAPATDELAAALDEWTKANEGHASDAVTVAVEQARATVEAERALVANDRAAARAAVEKLAESGDQKLLAALALDDAAAAFKAVEAIARESGDARLRIEASLALVRLEMATEPRAALRRLDTFNPTTEDARAGEKELRKLALAATAERAARDGIDPLEYLSLLERMDPAAAKDAMARVVRAAIGRVGTDSVRQVGARLARFFERDSSAFAQKELAPAFLGFLDEAFKAQDVPLTARAYEFAARADPDAALPGRVLEGLPSVTQGLLTRTGKTLDVILDIELAMVRIGEHSNLMDSFEETTTILAGLEKRLAAGSRDWALKMAIGGRVNERERGLKLIAEALASPDMPLRARVTAQVVRATHLRSLRKYDEALAEAETAIKAGYGKPDVMESAIAEMLLEVGRDEEALDWARRAARDADDRVDKANQGFEALAAGRPPGRPLQPTGAIGTALRARPRAMAVQALLLLGRFDEARAAFDEALGVGQDREAPYLRDTMTTCAARLANQGKSQAAAVARELAAKVKSGD